MTRQEIFDTVVRHLYSMPHRAMLKGNCAYRSDDGLKCAVGCLIPDEIYDPKMETFDILRLMVEWETLPAFFCSENIGLLIKLQSAHDFTANWKSNSGGPSEAMARELTEVATRYGLSPAVLHEVAPQ